jgi:hypothetical protein
MVVVVLVVIEQHLLEVLVEQLVLLQQTLEVLDMLVGLSDLILQMEVCKVLMQQVMQQQRGVQVQVVLRAQMEEHQLVHLLEELVLRVVSELLVVLVQQVDLLDLVLVLLHQMFMQMVMFLQRVVLVVLVEMQEMEVIVALELLVLPE